MPHKLTQLYSLNLACFTQPVVLHGASDCSTSQSAKGLQHMVTSYLFLRHLCLFFV